MAWRGQSVARSATGFRRLRFGLAAVAAPILLYPLAALILGAIPINRDWHEPARGITIYVATNGVHTGLLLPSVAGGVDWRGLVKPTDLADPRYAGRWLWFGWGERHFYLETPTWRDLRLATVLRAVVGSDATLLHVDHILDPAAEYDARPIRLTLPQYRTLARRISARFALRPDGSAIPIPGYGPADLFYEAHGRYDAITTCNSWTGDVLRESGIRIGWWTPLSTTVMWWF